MSRPVDIVFDSNNTDDPDNPRFNLSPALTNVVGYSVVWTNVTFSYFTVDLLNNIFMVYMKDDGSAFLNHNSVGSDVEGEPTAWYTANIAAYEAVYYRILIRLNPGTYRPTTFSHDMKRALGTEPIVEAVGVTSAGLVVDITSAFDNLAAPNNDKFAVEVDPISNRLIIWNTQHLEPFSIAVGNDDMSRITGFNISTNITTLATAITTVRKVTITTGVNDNFLLRIKKYDDTLLLLATEQPSYIIPAGQYTLQELETLINANNIGSGAFDFTITVDLTGGSKSKIIARHTIDELKYTIQLVGIVPSVYGTLGFSSGQTLLEEDVIAIDDTTEGVDIVASGNADTNLTSISEPFPGKSSSMGQLWQNGLVVKDSRTDPVVDEGAEPQVRPFPLQVQHVFSDNLANLTYSSTLNIHSSLMPGSLGAARAVQSNEPLLVQSPVLSTYGSYILYQPTNSEMPMTRSSLNQVEFWLTLGNRRLYTRGGYRFDDEKFETVNFLPLNGEGFQVCIRFFIDDGIKEQRQ